jgi:multidrug efflux pump subunit AcrB
MRSLVTYFIKYPIAANVILLLILIFGFFGMKSLRSTFFPETESSFISVQAVYPGASPSEIEEGIVLKIEDNLEGISGIDRITSLSSENIGVVTIEVSSEYNTDLVLQDVKNEVDRINSFPEGMEPPSIFINELSQLAISFAINGDLDLIQLKQISRNVENDLKEIKGISKVELTGFPDEEIEISLTKEAIEKYNISLDEVAAAVRQNNLEITGGEIKGDKENFLIRSDNKARVGRDLQNIVVKTLSTGQVIHLDEISIINDTWVDSPIKKEFNKQLGVVVNVNYTIYEDMITIVDEVKNYVEKFNQKNNTVQASIINDRSKVLKERIDLLTENGVVGFFLVLIFLSMFLHPRIAAWVALSIPICFAGMFILASFAGISINVISLFGMIIVIGILVDDGIVISENIYQHFERGKTPVKAAIDGTLEVFPAVFSAILTTIIAFSIFFMLDGIMGDFFMEMGFVVIATLIFSLVEGLFILPAHVAHSKALTQKALKNPNVIIKKFTAFLNWTRVKFYDPLIKRTLDSPVVSIAVFVGLFLISTSLTKAGLVKFSFFPSIQGDFLTVNLEMQPGTNEKVTNKWIDYAEAKILEINEELKSEEGIDIIEGIEKTTGPASHKAALKLILAPSEERTIITDDIRNLIISRVNDIPDKEKFSVRGGGPFGRPVSIAFYSRDDKELEIVKKSFITAIDNLGVLSNIESSDEKGTVEFNIVLNDKAKSLGLTYFQIMDQVRRAFFGQEIQRIQRGIDEVKIWVRYNENNRDEIGDLENLRIKSNGKEFLLKDLAVLERDRGVVAIKHIDGKKTILIEADILNEQKTSSGEVTAALKDSIIPNILANHPTVSFSEEGQAREIAKTAGSIKKVGLVIIILMFSVVVLTFRSFSQTIAVFVMSAFGIIGILWGHFIHGHNLSIFSIFGIIALIGVMINDSLVFINAFNQNLKEGKKFKDALLETGISRYRPIVLTSVTTIAGLAPLIFEKSMQAQFLIPMAITIAYGLMFATLLTLVFLPGLLTIINWIKRCVVWIKTGEWVSPESVEPAVKEIPYENMKFD